MDTGKGEGRGQDKGEKSDRESPKEGRQGEPTEYRPV